MLPEHNYFFPWPQVTLFNIYYRVSGTCTTLGRALRHAVTAWLCYVASGQDGRTSPSAQDEYTTVYY